jgi:4-methyl-5(b-hydroxyethyl)-thiazole monophosphate biosynthesis
MKKVLIVLADGFEEIEAITPIDVLRRADIQVVVAGLEKRSVTGSHGIKVEADILLKDFKETPDAIVLPGGPGAETLGKSVELRNILEYLNKEGKWIGAICAAPAVVLGKTSILDGKKATCFPGCEKQLGAKTIFSTDRVVKDGRVITSRGPGSALEFSLELVRSLADPKKAAEIAEKMVAKV